MKSLLKGLLLSLFLASFWIHGETLWSSRLFLNEPRIHVIQEGEYLSKIAQQYYGKASYWRALALLNRAPDPDKIYPGERIMLPDAAAVARIARARRLSEVNEIAFEQEQMAKIETDEELTEFRNRQKGQFHQAVVTDEPAEPEPEIQSVLQATEEPRESLSLPASELPPPPKPLETDQAVLQDEVPTSTETNGGGHWLWPAIIVAMLILGSGYVYVRRRREDDDAGALADEGEPVWETVEKHSEAESAGRPSSSSKSKDEALLVQ